MRRVLLALLLSLVWLSAGPVNAASEAEREAARALGGEALRLYQRKQYEEAYEGFAKANRLLQAPTLGLYMARCQKHLGKLGKAYQLYRIVVDASFERGAPWQYVKAQRDARRELEKLEPKVPALTVHVRGAPERAVRVAVDGDGVEGTRLGEPLRLDAGRHSIEASAEGYESAAATVSLEEGSDEAVTLTLRPAVESGDGDDGEKASDEVGQGPLWPAGVAFGVAAMGLGLGAVTGGVAAAETDDIESRCVDNHCPVGDAGQADDARALAGVSTAGFIVAGIGAAAGVVLLVWRPGATAEGTTALKLGPGHLRFEGKF